MLKQDKSRSQAVTNIPLTVYIVGAFLALLGLTMGVLGPKGEVTTMFVVSCSVLTLAGMASILMGLLSHRTFSREGDSILVSGLLKKETYGVDGAEIVIQGDMNTSTGGYSAVLLSPSKERIPIASLGMYSSAESQVDKGRWIAEALGLPYRVEYRG